MNERGSEKQWERKKIKESKQHKEQNETEKPIPDRLTKTMSYMQHTAL